MKEAENRWHYVLEMLIGCNFIPVMFLVIFGFCSHGAIAAAGDKSVVDGEFWLFICGLWAPWLAMSVLFAFGDEITE